MNITKLNHIHFVGIKGVGLTSLALCAQDLGIKITGSDVAEEFVTDEILNQRGIKWNIGFNENNLKPKPDLVITTGAHGGLKNPEVVAAGEMGIAVMTHEEALAAFAKGKKMIAVCGVGGKSTTAAMIATVFDRAGLCPSYAIGVGGIDPLGAPGKYDRQGSVFVTEADEYAISPGIDNRPKFSLLDPKVIVVTNIEHDHPDVYSSIGQTKKAFREFFQKLPIDGLLVANYDDKNVRAILSEVQRPTTTYGFSDKADVNVGNEKFELKVPGRFNRANATAALIAAKFFNVSAEKISAGLEEFLGTRRRLERMGEKNGIEFWDDYAHHPLEIRAVLTALKERVGKRRLIVIFQPHTYSRTKALFDEFSRSFGDGDVIGIMDIYASAREPKTDDVSAQQLVEEIKKYNRQVSYLGGHDTARRFLRQIAKSGDVVVTLGAGDVFLLHQREGDDGP